MSAIPSFAAESPKEVTADAGLLPPDLRALFGGERRAHSGEVSEGPSESSAHIEDTDDDFRSKIPHLEQFYEELAAKARLPERHGASASNWVLSMARSYRRLSNEKRRRGRLRAMLRPVAQEGDGDLAVTDHRGLTCASDAPGHSSNTDDSGYEAGYETDADESELSEWESSKPQRHKRKLEALVHLTMRLSVSERGEEETMDGDETVDDPNLTPLKVPRALGTRPVGLRLPLPNGPPPVPAFHEPATCVAVGSGASASNSAASLSAYDTTQGRAWIAPERSRELLKCSLDGGCGSSSVGSFRTTSEHLKAGVFADNAMQIG